MKNIFKNIKNYFKDNKTKSITILVVLILTIISSITLIAYSFYQNKSTKLIISGLALIDSSDVSIKVYRENKNDNGVGLGTYALSYYVPSATSYTYQSSKTVCDTGITIEKYENQKFYVDATKKGKCKVYFDAIDGYIDDYEVNLFVQQEVGNTDDKNYNQMGQLPLYETGYYYTINTSKTSCTNGATVSIVGRNIVVLTTKKAVCNVYADKNSDSESPTIGNDLKVENDTLTVTLNDNAMLGSYGLSSSSEIEPEEWIEIPTTPYSLSTPITSDTPYLWVKDAAGNVNISSEMSFGPYGWETILINNGNGATTVDAAKAYIEGRTTSTTPNFSVVAKTNEGMYAADDDYTETTGMKSYYFRGAVDNNWVKFGKDSTGKDIYWRIIRINGDGSIRMIYSGTTKPSEDTSVTGSNGVYMTGTGTQITVDSTNTFKFNSSYDKAEYVGYMYTEGQQHGNSTPSTIKQAIENWYAGTTLKDNDLIADQIFCNDRSASTSNVTYSNTNYTTLTSWNSTGTQYYYGAKGRLNKSKSPQLTCPTASDKYTVGTSNGNGALTYPVGLITADEVAMAGGVYGSSNTNSSYYLYTNQKYWLGSPYAFENVKVLEFIVESLGFLRDYKSKGSNGARPVVSLSSKAKLLGNGTYSNPYTVS